MEIIKRTKKHNGYWSKERCKQEALKYNNYTDFRNNSNSACCAIKKNKWSKELCDHFLKRGSKQKRFIYSYEFPDKSVYVGLTYNINKRKQGHLNSGTVFEYCYLSGLTPVFKVLTEDPVDVEAASKLETLYLEEYKQKSWVILNKVKTGGIGGNNLKWNFNTLSQEALKYSSKSNFEKTNSSAYNTALRKGIIDDICRHMIKLKQVSGFWNFYNCKTEALKYNKRVDFQKNNSSAYKASIKNKWLDIVCSHMDTIKKPNGYYTLEKCIEIARVCKDTRDMKKRYGTAYNKIFKNKWSNEIKQYFDSEYKI